VLSEIYFFEEGLNTFPIFSLHFHQNRSFVKLLKSKSCIMMLHPLVATIKLIDIEVLFGYSVCFEDGRNYFYWNYLAANNFFRKRCKHHLKQKFDFMIAKVPIYLAPIILSILCRMYKI